MRLFLVCRFRRGRCVRTLHSWRRGRALRDKMARLQQQILDEDDRRRASRWRFDESPCATQEAT